MKTEELLKQLSVCIKDVRDPNLKKECRIFLSICQKILTKWLNDIGS